MQDDVRFGVPKGADGQSLAAIVAEDYALKAEEPAETEVIFYDTFDWRLFNKSVILCQSGSEWVVRRLLTGANLERLAGGSPPSFVWELVDGPLRRSIGSIVGDRRLFRVGEARVHTTPYRVLNADGKTVARLRSTEMRVGPGVQVALLDTTIELLAVRGYPGHFRRLAVRFREAGLAASDWQDTFQRILAAESVAAPRQPGGYSAKPDYRRDSFDRRGGAPPDI